MGKGKKPSVMRKAAGLRAQYRKKLMVFLVVLAVCLAILLVYWFFVANAIYQNESMLPWALALVAAGVIGVLGNKFSKAHREYEAFLDDHGISNFDVVQFIKKQ